MSYRDFDFDAEGRDDIIRMEIEAEAQDVWTEEVSAMYAELDMNEE